MPGEMEGWMTAIVSNVRGFLEQEQQMFRLMQNENRIGDYRSMGEFVLRNGRNFEPAPLPPDVKRGKMKECYLNAGQLSTRNPDRFIYCEGYALGVIPVMHAWCVDLEGRVVEPTWKDGTEYFGVAIKHGYLIRMMQRTETWGVIDHLPLGSRRLAR